MSRTEKKYPSPNAKPGWGSSWGRGDPRRLCSKPEGKTGDEFDMLIHIHQINKKKFWGKGYDVTNPAAQ